MLDVAALLTQLEKLAAIETSPRARFTYVPLPKDLVDKLSALQEQVCPVDGVRQEMDHITLVYVKKADEAVAPADIDKAVRTIRDIVAHTLPIHAKVQGWGYFDGAKKDGVDKTALVGLIDAPGLEDLHVELKGALRSIGITPSADHIFTPHVTFCYLEKGKRVENLPSIGGEFTIDKVCFVNTEVHEMVLGSAVAEQLKAAAAPRDDAPGMGIRDGRGYGPYGMGYYHDGNDDLPYGPAGEKLSKDYDYRPGPKGFLRGRLEPLKKVAATLRHDTLPGGKGDHLQPSDVSPRELLRGKATESEHTSNKALAQEIALDHLSEDRHYYSKLEKAMPGEVSDGTKAALARFGLHGVPSSTRRP